MTVRKLRCVVAAFVLGLFNVINLPMAQAADCDNEIAATLDDDPGSSNNSTATFNPRRHSDIL